MEPWQGGGAPWCIGSMFPAPQLLTGPVAIPLGPLFFDGIGTLQCLLSIGSPLSLFESFTPSISEQKEEFLSFPGDVYVREDILEEHLQEDTVVRKAIGVYRSQILGNRLQLVECRDGDVTLFFPTGNNGDRIGSMVCSRDNTVKRWHDASSHQSVPNSTFVPLRQPIFQLLAVRKDAWDPDCGFLVAARSLYNVQFLAANQEKSEVRFSRPMVASFAKYVSHVAWNQHMQGEAAVVLETGEVLLFDLQRGWSTNKWLHGMDAEPLSVLAMCPIPSSSQGSSDKGKVILAASFHSGNIQAFCYGPHPAPASPPQNGLITTSMPSHLGPARTHGHS